MKFKSTLLAAAIALGFNAGAQQFFDTVPFRGAFGITGSTRTGLTGYIPDATNTNADWTAGWSNWDPNNTAYPGDAGWSPNATHPAPNGNKVVVSGDISSNTTWSSNNWYELSGTVHVLNGATLTIQPGTVIRGNSANIGVLIIAKGGKLNAVGTVSQPIVITSGKAAGSRVRGDWGGLLLIGNAHTNTPGGKRQYEALPTDPLTEYGGGANPNDAESSGTLRYLRVEYGGYNYLPDQEINGITFAGVGNGTHADYIQVSYANDDSYEWFGGTVNHKYLIAFSGTDDDFDMDEGYNGKCQYLLGVRNPAIFETSPTGTSNGLEHDNNTNLGTSTQITPGITAPTPTTAPVISNMTLSGPIKPGSSRSSLSSTAQSRYGRALEFRSNVSTSVFNSIIWGYPTVFQLGNPNNTLTPSVQTRLAADEMVIRNDVFIRGTGSDVLFNSTNAPTTFNGNPFSMNTAEMQTMLINGPSVGFTGATNNDIARTTITDGTDMIDATYQGNSNGSLAQIVFAGQVNYMLPAGSPFYGNTSFRHPKVPVVPQPFIGVDVSALPAFNIVIGQPSPVKSFSLNVANLAGNVTVNAPANFEVSFSATTGFASSISKNGPTFIETVYVRFTRSAVGSSSGFISISSSVPADFATINIGVSGSATAPATPFVNASVSALAAFSTTAGTASAEKWFSVTGAHITAPVSIYTSSQKFKVSLSATTGFDTVVLIPTPAGGKLNPTTIYVTYNPAVAANDNGSVTIASANAESSSVTVSGTSASTLAVSPSGYAEWQIIAGTPSLAYPITVTGTRLTDVVNVTAPANFQLSTDSAFTTPGTTLSLNSGMAASFSQKIYARYAAAATATNTGNVAFSSTGATTANTAVIGRSLAVGAKILSVSSTASTLNFTTVFDGTTPSASQKVMLNAMNLGANDSVRIITTNFNFEVSDNGTSYNDTLFLVPTSGSITKDIWVRYNPIVAGSLNQQMVTALWSNGAAQTTPAAVAINLNGQSSPIITVAPATLPKMFAAVGKTSASAKLVISAIRLISDVTVTAPASFEISTDSSSYSSSVVLTRSGNTLASTNLFVRFKPTAAGATPAASLSFSATNAASVPVSVSGLAVLAPTPVLNLSVGSLTTFRTSANGPTAAQSFTLSAIDLQDSLTISVGGDFELSNDSATYKKTWKISGDANGQINNLKLYCRLNRTSNGSVSDSILFNSTGLLATQKILVSGYVNVNVPEVVNNLERFVMYPNPATSSVNIDFELKNTSLVTVRVIDLSGRTVKEVNVNELYSKGANSLSFDVSDLNSGMYFVNIESMNGSKTSRLMIAK